MKKFLIYYFYFAGILFTINDERFLGISSTFFWENCRDNPTNLYIFLISTALILLAIIAIPRFKAEGNKLQVEFSQIQDLEISIIGVVPFFQIRFFYDLISNNFSKFFKKIPEILLWENQSKVVSFLMVSILIVGLIFAFTISIPIALIFLILFIYLSLAPLASIVVIVRIISPDFFDFIQLSLKSNPYLAIGFTIITGIFALGSIGLSAHYVLSEQGYSSSRKVQYSLDVENRILRNITNPKEDIPLHTLSSFRRHSIYPTGIILNNGNLLDSPNIDWRITTNKNIGTTDELINYLNKLILEAKIQKEKEKELLEQMQSTFKEYWNENRESLAASFLKWCQNNIKL